jgi:hypothetical protein
MAMIVDLDEAIKHPLDDALATVLAELLGSERDESSCVFITPTAMEWSQNVVHHMLTRVSTSWTFPMSRVRVSRRRRDKEVKIMSTKISGRQREGRQWIQICVCRGASIASLGCHYASLFKTCLLDVVLPKDGVIASSVATTAHTRVCPTWPRIDWRYAPSPRRPVWICWIEYTLPYPAYKSGRVKSETTI